MFGLVLPPPVIPCSFRCASPPLISGRVLLILALRGLPNIRLSLRSFVFASIRFLLQLQFHSRALDGDLSCPHNNKALREQPV